MLELEGKQQTIQVTVSLEISVITRKISTIRMNYMYSEIEGFTM